VKRTSFVGHIAGLFRELEIDKLIDEKLPEKMDHKIPHSICILALVINGLGFVGQHPKNGRWDLKQFVLSLIVNQQGIPFFMNAHSGNAPDKITIIEVIKSLKSKLTHENKVYYVADNSFYKENNIKKIGNTFWISRVTSTITEVKDLLTANLSLENLKSDDRYSFYETFVDYGGVKQKWVLLLSHKIKEKKEKTLKNKCDKEIEKASKSLKKLMGQDFFCEEDALKAADIWIQDFPYVEFDKIELKSIKRRESGKKGRPLKDEILKTYYEIEAEIETNKVRNIKYGGC
jgi:transposase